MKNEEAIILDDFSRGNLRKTQKSLTPRNAVKLGLNLTFSKKLGSAVVRSGSNTRIGGQVVNDVPCLGLFQFITSAGTKTLFGVWDDGTSPSNSDIYIASGTPLAWSKSSEDWTKTQKMRSVSFLNTLAVFNGADACKAYTTSWVATGGNLDIANMPKFKFAVEWKDRIYGAGVVSPSSYPDRLYYSSIPDSGAISWTSGNGYIDIEPDVGEAITGLGKVPGYLLIFKERSLKRWDGNSTYPDDLINIGTPSHDSICYGKAKCFFFNYKGIYATNGGYPVLLSRPIDDFIKAIPASFYSSVAGYCDEETARWEIGDVTVDGESYTNVVIVYNIDDETWEIYSYPTEFRRMIRYIDPSTSAVKILGADDDGQVLQIDDGSHMDYSSKSIEFILQTEELDFGTRKLKALSSIVFETRNAEGANVMYRIDGGEWFGLKSGSITDSITEFKNISLRGHWLEFKLTDVTSDEAEILAIEIPPQALEVFDSYN